MISKNIKKSSSIMDKVQLGYKSFYQESLFSRFTYFKKPDLIKPHMHYLDENALSDLITNIFSDHSVLTQESLYREFLAKKPHLLDKGDQFLKYVIEAYDKLSDNLFYDIHKLYYYKMKTLDFVDRTEVNNWKFKLLEKFNNPVSKIMTERSNLKSAVFVKNLVLLFCLQLAALRIENQEDYENIIDGMDDDKVDNNKVQPGPDSQPCQPSEDEISEIIDNIFNSEEGKVDLEKAMEQAQAECNKIDENIPENIQEQLFRNSDNNCLSEGYLDNVSSKLQNIKISMRGLKDKIKHLLNKSYSYFSSKSKTQYEDLFNTTDVSSIEDYSMLHPKLRKFMVEDVLVKENKPIGKISLYIDNSGSMGDNCTRDEEGNVVSKLDFCKSFAAKLKEYDLLDELYVFNDRVYKQENSLLAISLINESGGTNINHVVEFVNKNNTNAIIITDAEDHCSLYSDKAFFIGVNGASFKHFKHLNEYRDNDQVIIFDGESIYKVDEKGKAVK